MVCFSLLKMMMFVFNGIIFLGGLALLGIGIWVKVDGGSFAKVLGAAAPQLMQLINVGYLLIAVGTFLLLMGFMGCWGAAKESKCLLLVANVRQARDITGIWATTMKELKCCGFNNYADFNNSYFYQTHAEKYPSFCCSDNNECQESEVDHGKQGCLNEFQVFLSRNGKIVGGVALAVGVLELAALAVSLILYCQIGKYA
nr:tetraspanin-16 [Zootoca vivipara]